MLIGQGLPRPAPKVVMDALQSVQVTNSKQTSGFQLSFAVGKNSPLLKVMLPAGYFDPIITRVIIIATLNGIPSVLMDGLITNQELSASNEPGQSTLSITGEDISLAMDLVDYYIPMKLSEAQTIRSILAKYAFLGVVPIIIPPFIPGLVPFDKYYIQTTTDRAYIKSIASQCGFVFFIQPGPLPGQNIAYFGPDVNIPEPQRAVSVNWDALSNAESMSFSLDGLAKKIRRFTVYNNDGDGKVAVSVPIPDINIFKPPMGLKLTPPAKFDKAEEVAKLKFLDANKAILAFLMDPYNSNAVTGNGSISVTRYNQILRSRMLVGVRGAGLAYDGVYYVDSVTHNIKKGEYKQSFSISRDGLISNTSFVLP